jgi:hypothetical protein
MPGAALRRAFCCAFGQIEGRHGCASKQFFRQIKISSVESSFVLLMRHLG